MVEFNSLFSVPPRPHRQSIERLKQLEQKFASVVGRGDMGPTALDLEAIDDAASQYASSALSTQDSLPTPSPLPVAKKRGFQNENMPKPRPPSK